MRVRIKVSINVSIKVRIKGRIRARIRVRVRVRGLKVDGVLEVCIRVQSALGLHGRGCWRKRGWV